ncbi:hypothetical protein BGZ89_001258 [Linnemannia elongata]|nr:hypothetical protein BGZ89_001258 [Linnemannia elongata]
MLQQCVFHPRIISSPTALTLDRPHQESNHLDPVTFIIFSLPRRQQQKTFLTTSDTTLPLKIAVLVESQRLLLLHSFSTRLALKQEPIVCEHILPGQEVTFTTFAF